MVNFASAEIDVVVHATEDSRKILHAIREVFPIEPEEFVATSTKGHFGNDIIYLKVNLNSERATAVAHKIIGMMSHEDRMSMYDNFDLYTDEKNTLYLRISKQKIFDHKVILAQSDSLKIKLKTVRRFQSSMEMENYRKLLLQGDDD